MSAVEPGDAQQQRDRTKPVTHDRWAHRRGEPRVLAFLWTLYLLGATLLGFAALGAVGGISPDTYRPVARIILITVVVGIVLMWPMVRLSQARPRRGGAKTACGDFIVIVIPAQAVVWPQAFLPTAQWSVSTIVALSMLMCAWAVCMAGLLALALGRGGRESARRPPAHAWLWMLLVILVSASGTVVALSGSESGDVNSVRTRWLASPMTGVYELMRDRPHTSRASRLSRDDWAIIAAPAAVGIVLWLLAAMRRPRDDVPTVRRAGV